MQTVERHIASLETRLKDASQASNDLQLRYDAAQVQHQVDLNATLNNLRQQLEIAHHSELHKVMQAGKKSRFHILGNVEPIHYLTASRADSSSQ